ncbi:MAG: hypothetical protein ACTSX1_02610 [Candidatus Heimdallarchaeaceae archaeon]
MQKIAIELMREVGPEDIYKIINVVFYDQTHYRAGRYYCYSTPEQGLRVRNAYMDGHKLIIGKEKLEQMVTLEDFEKVEINTSKERKLAKLTELYNILNDKMAVVTGLSLYSFFSDMVMLAAHGYFITDDNREEVYLKIIDTADEDLIQCLETYLDSKDKIDGVTSFNRKATSLIRNLEKTETDEEIEKALEEYEEFGIC